MTSPGRLLLLTILLPACVDDGVVTDVDVEFEEDQAALPTSEAPEALRDAAHAIEELVLEDAALLTGARLSDGELVIALPDGDDVGDREQTIRARLTLEGFAADDAVRFERVTLSRADMDAVRSELRERVIDGDLGDDEVTGLGSDPSRGVVIVYATDASHETRKALKEEYGDAVVFRRGERNELFSRGLDIAPHWGGAGYGVVNNAGTSMRTPWCSTAFPVDVGGVHYMLTAGHCLPTYTTTWVNDWIDAWAEDTTVGYAKYHFGKRAASSHGFFTHLYGDWALLEGSTYKARVYETNTTAVDVAQVDWGLPSMGEQVCRSGRTTGKTCRLIVTDTDFEGTFCDSTGKDCKWVTQLVAVKSDQNLDGVGDCNVGKGGDSGGAVFQWAGAKLRAMGIVTGGTTKGTSTCSDDRGYYTRLSGPKAFFKEQRGQTMTMPVIP